MPTFCRFHPLGKISMFHVSLRTALWRLLCAFSLLAVTLPALAHEGGGIVGGFSAGLMHPLSGPDHILAMVAVGIWGAFLGAPAIWVLPVVFPLVMAVGGAMGVLGIALPATETGIALSSLVLGLLIAFAKRTPLWLAAGIVGAFAVFHGYAHGVELPNAADPMAYSLGFVMVTGMLHLCGIAFGELTRWKIGNIFVRVTGAGIACGGFAFLGGWI
jgi:urease accessory protein